MRSRSCAPTAVPGLWVAAYDHDRRPIIEKLAKPGPMRVRTVIILLVDIPVVCVVQTIAESGTQLFRKCQGRSVRVAAVSSVRVM